MNSIPRIGGREDEHLRTIAGVVPSLYEIPPAAAFATDVLMG